LFRIISQLKSVVQTKELIIEQQEAEKKEIVATVTRPLEEQIRHLEAKLGSKEPEVELEAINAHSPVHLLQ